MNSQEITYYSAGQWEGWLDHLARNDYLVIDNFISDHLFQTIQQYFHTLLTEQEFDKAAIGSSRKRQVASSIRGDFIYWLHPSKDTGVAKLFELLDHLVVNLKRYLFLGISDYEFHFALYPPETRYEKHIDQFKGQSNRLISVLIYLNEHWTPGDGGELKIFERDGTERLVEPTAKRLVMFKSDTVEHEVMLTKTHRKSLTGWLLRQPASLGHLL